MLSKIDAVNLNTRWANGIPRNPCVAAAALEAALEPSPYDKVGQVVEKGARAPEGGMYCKGRDGTIGD